MRKFLIFLIFLVSVCWAGKLPNFEQRAAEILIKHEYNFDTLTGEARRKRLELATAPTEIRFEGDVGFYNGNVRDRPGHERFKDPERG
ncbi:unnamed protein product [Caenorhabditis angaria]|uniref:Uncharacterized protein n=1 Tax=Caenorhabditis angaria TaxID=860376 RepID=A0A9P1IN89_9PELO|nr:unnamed protein product [Caenorhabditis angaria]